MPDSRKFIPVSMPTFLGNEKQYVIDCLDSGWISSIGKYIEQFERSFADFCRVSHAVSCSNGTAALHLALLALGITAGDEVIVPTLTFVATANAVRYCGATPVFVDSEPLTMNLDPALVEASITPRTRAIIVVHLYGHPVDMDPVIEVARKHGLFVIEDAAEAHGAEYKGRRAGSLGDIAIFSFFGNKVISTGEGGMVTTDREDLAHRVRRLRGQGMQPDRRYWFPEIGYNYRMTNVAAAIGLAQTQDLHRHLEMRRQVADWYNHYLRASAAPVELPVEMPWAVHSFWMYTIVLSDTVAMSGEQFREGLACHGIDSRPVFYPMHTMPPFFENTRYPVSERLSARGVNLPTHGQLTEGDVEFISAAIAEICARC